MTRRVSTTFPRSAWERDKQAGGTTGGKLGEFIQEASTWSLADRIQAAKLIEKIYSWHGWGPKKKRPKKKEMLKELRKDS